MASKVYTGDTREFGTARLSYYLTYNYITYWIYKSDTHYFFIVNDRLYYYPITTPRGVIEGVAKRIR